MSVIPNSVLDPKKDRYILKDIVKVTCAEGYEIVRVSEIKMHMPLWPAQQHLEAIPFRCPAYCWELKVFNTAVVRGNLFQPLQYFEAPPLEHLCQMYFLSKDLDGSCVLFPSNEIASRVFSPAVRKMVNGATPI